MNEYESGRYTGPTTDDGGREALTPDDVERLQYLAGHLAASEDYPDDPHAGDSRDLALDGFADWLSGHVAAAVAAERERVAVAIEAGAGEHGGMMMPHGFASDCSRCFMDRAATIARSGS